MQKYTLAQMKTMNSKAGQHWFDKGSMAFFGTEFVSQPNNWNCFTTSEQPPHGERKCSLRMFVPSTAHVVTVGPFCQMDQNQAYELKKTLARAFTQAGARERAVLENLKRADVWDSSEDCIKFESDNEFFVVRVRGGNPDRLIIG